LNFGFDSFFTLAASGALAFDAAAAAEFRTCCQQSCLFLFILRKKNASKAID